MKDTFEKKVEDLIQQKGELENEIEQMNSNLKTFKKSQDENEEKIKQVLKNLDKEITTLSDVIKTMNDKNFAVRPNNDFVEKLSAVLDKFKQAKAATQDPLKALGILKTIENKRECIVELLTNKEKFARDYDKIFQDKVLIENKLELVIEEERESTAKVQQIKKEIENGFKMLKKQFPRKTKAYQSGSARKCRKTFEIVWILLYTNKKKKKL